MISPKKKVSVYHEEKKIKHWTLGTLSQGKEEKPAKETEKEQVMRYEENRECMRYPGSQMNKAYEGERMRE